MRATLTTIAARLSALAYLDDLGRLQATLRDLGLSYLAWHRTDDDIEFLIVRDHHTGLIIVAIRGTETTSWRDILTDVRALRRRLIVSGQVLRCHAGGLAAAHSIAGTIATRLRNFPFDRILITGHSLGGLIARILRALLPAHHSHATGGRAIHCITFGAPRSGCPRFASHLNAADGYDIRVEHPFDPVTYVPGALSAFLPRRFSRYCHSGQAHTIPSPARGIAAHKMSLYLSDVLGEEVTR